MIYYDGVLMKDDYADHTNLELYYEEKCEKAAEARWKKKILELYYDCCERFDRSDDDWWSERDYKIQCRLNKFFQDNLNKTL